MRMLFLLVFCVAGCGPTVEYSEQLTEPGTVYDTAFIPEGHGRDTAVGITTNGDMSVTPIHITIPARYAVVFKCQHGKFVIDGDKAKGLYDRLERGQDVTIYYREVYELQDDQRTLVDLDFLDAVPAKNEP